MLEFSQEGQSVQPTTVQKPVTAPSHEFAVVPASFVASTFVEQYYRTLGNAPHQLHRFYCQDSVFARLEPGDALSMDADSKLTVIGQIAIHAKIRDLGYKGCKALIDTIDFQDSIDGSVLVLISGFISNNGGKPRSFTQTILLARQERGYYVRNDILRFVQRIEDGNKVVTPPSSEPIQPGFASVSDTKFSEVSVASMADVANEGNKETVTETVDHSPKQSDFHIDIEMKTEEVSPEPALTEEIDPKEEVPVPAPPAKPTSWAALFTKSMPGPVPSSSIPISTPQSVVPSVQNEPSASEPTSKSPDYACHLFVQNLPDCSTEAEIASLFTAYGAVDSVDILTKRTMAFVIFDNAEGAEAALKAKTIMLQGRELQVSPRKPRNQINNRVRGRAGRGRHVARARKQDDRQQS